MKATDYDGNLGVFLKNYRFQPDLTRRLDNLARTLFTQQIVNEILLWKVSRYVALDASILNALNSLVRLAQGEHRRAESVVVTLLDRKGIDLPMASTFLRFRNPAVFQVMDRHAYRAVYDQPYLFYAGTPPPKKVSAYFDYLDALLDLCKRRHLDFSTIDRVLYMFDKSENGHL